MVMLPEITLGDILRDIEMQLESVAQDVPAPMMEFGMPVTMPVILSRMKTRSLLDQVRKLQFELECALKSRDEWHDRVKEVVFDREKIRDERDEWLANCEREVTRAAQEKEKEKETLSSACASYQEVIEGLRAELASNQQRLFHLERLVGGMKLGTLR